jgi:hypothetical protein
MNQARLDERLYKEAKRRAHAAGFSSVDEFVPDRLESDFSDPQEDFDDRFTPPVVAHPDMISAEMLRGKSVSQGELDQHLADVHKTWIKDSKTAS